MEKTLEIEEGKKIIEKFINFHLRNFPYSSGYYRLKLDFSRDEHNDEEYFSVFKSILISHFENNYEKQELLEIPSFIFYEKLQEDRWGRKEELIIGNLKLQEYLELIRDSKFPFDYLWKLEEFKERNDLIDLLFSKEEATKFCSKHVYHNLKHNDYLVEIKKIEPKKYQYSYEGEKERFDKIDKLWREGDYHSTIDECDTLLGHFIKNLYEIKTEKSFSFTDGEKDQEIKIILEEITSNCELPELKGSLNNVIKEFNNMRNKLGKSKPLYKTGEKRWQKFNELSEIKKKLYVRMIIDLLKSLHNSLLIIQRGWKNF